MLDQVAYWRDKCEAAYTRIAELEALLESERITIPFEFRLTRREEQILEVLIRRERPQKDDIMAVVYGDRRGHDVPDQKILDVYIHRLRDKMRKFGIEIGTLWGNGYNIPIAHKEKIRNWKR